ncbi:MAG: hypothetical protein ABSF13_14100 [Smithella sp.]|jgi:hypothetical protein
MSVKITKCLTSGRKKKNPISESAELLTSPTTIQWQAVVGIEDYHV